MSEFLAIELHAANLFVALALAPCSLENRARYVYNARQAFDTVVQFALRAALNRAEVAQVKEELHCVRWRLERLGEEDLGEVSVWDSFASACTAGKVTPQPANEDSKQRHLTVRALGRMAQRFAVQCRQLRCECGELLAQNQSLMKKRPESNT